MPPNFDRWNRNRRGRETVLRWPRVSLSVVTNSLCVHVPCLCCHREKIIEIEKKEKKSEKKTAARDPYGRSGCDFVFF